MKKLLQIVTNKFVITGTGFLVWMAFFDQNDFMAQQQRKKDLQAAKDNVAYLNGEIDRMEKEHAAMVSNPQQLEKYARENFRMKRDNEDLYIIEKNK